MNKKKKYLIALTAFIICSIMFTFAIKAQRIYADKTSKTESAETSKKHVDNKPASKVSADTKKAEEKKAEEKKVEEKKAEEQKKASANEEKKNETSTATEASNSSSASSSDKNQGQGAPSVAADSGNDASEEASITFIDTVNGNRVILQKTVDMEGKTVGYITCKLLDDANIKYKTTGSGSMLYFAAIDGLEEKKAGRLSGWCYYVKKKGDTKFHKPNVGAGQWIYHNGDVVVWKYLADGIHDGYSDDWDK